MSKHSFNDFGQFMETPPIGTRLMWLGVSKAFFTKPRTKARVKQFVQTMWDVRKKKVIDPNTWNEAALVYGNLPLWKETNDDIVSEIQVGEDI